MQRFKSILFVADGSEGEKSVLACAVRLASANSAKLTLFAGRDAGHEGAEERRNELERLREEAIAQEPGLTIDVETGTGATAESVIQAVLDHHHGLVMKAAAADAGTWKRLFGTEDQKLMRKSPCPVWIVKHSEEPRLRRILAAVDLNPTQPETEALAKKLMRKSPCPVWIVKHSEEPRLRRILAAVDLNPTQPETEALAKQIMEVSTSLAAEEGSELHVVHVWRMASETALRGRSIDTTEVDEMVRGIEAAHQSELDRLLEPHPYDKRTVHLIEGQAGKVIPDLAETLEVDLVVIGTLGRGGILGFLVGNEAERTLNAVDCSVLTLTPDGFETPLQV